MAGVTVRQTRRVAPHVLLGLLVLALLAACGSGPSSLDGPPIPRAPAARPLTWAPHLPPTDAPEGTNVDDTLAVAPSDGKTAYLCAPTPESQSAGVQVWVTRDEGGRWTPTAPAVVHGGADGPANDCNLYVDQTNSGTVVVEADYIGATCADCPGAFDYVSRDYGAHWQPLHVLPVGNLVELATHGSTAYALFGSLVGSSDPVLARSTDGMRTWTTLPVPLGSYGPQPVLPEQVTQFWLNPWGGPPWGSSLLAETTNLEVTDEHFWTSTDGLHWSSVGAPPFSFDTSTIIVQQPFAEAPWSICGGNPSAFGTDGQNENTHINDIACTTDGGASWVIRSLGTSGISLVAIADDGDLLYTYAASGELKRLTISSGREESLGTLPYRGASQPMYANGGGNGMLWSGPGNGEQVIDPQERVFTAPYA